MTNEIQMSKLKVQMEKSRESGKTSSEQGETQRNDGMLEYWVSKVEKVFLLVQERFA
jgi:hypothetical protein